jgi:Holliday junction resolvasome RuvABC endonuclease subunit
MTKSLALDASLTNCGYCIGIDGEYQESGQYKPNDKTDWIDRIQEISRWLYSLTMEHNFDVVFYEKPSGHSGNKDTDLKLGALWFSVQLFCRLRNIDFVNVSPKEIKATGICKGQLDNPYKHFDVPMYRGKPNQSAIDRIGDELDAIGLMLASWQKYE